MKHVSATTMLSSKNVKSSEEIGTCLHRVTANIKGSDSYWANKQPYWNKMDDQFGPATFFVTLSFPDYSAEDVRQYIIAMNKDVENVNYLSNECLVKMDPVATQCAFGRRWNAFQKVIFGSPRNNNVGIFGAVEQYMWRMEFQARGAPDIHMKIWIKNAPIVNKESSNNEEIITFLQDKIACRLPDRKTHSDDRLLELVKRHQKHNNPCNSTCFKD